MTGYVGGGGKIAWFGSLCLSREMRARRCFCASLTLRAGPFDFFATLSRSGQALRQRGIDFLLSLTARLKPCPDTCLACGARDGRRLTGEAAGGAGAAPEEARVRAGLVVPSPKGDSGISESIPGTAVPGYRLLRPFGTEVCFGILGDACARLGEGAGTGGGRITRTSEISGDGDQDMDIPRWTDQEATNSSVTRFIGGRGKIAWCRVAVFVTVRQERGSGSAAVLKRLQARLQVSPR